MDCYFLNARLRVIGIDKSSESKVNVEKVVQKEEIFRTPKPAPLKDFDISVNDPKLYRPFRHGPNHITMGIRKLEWDEWIEMDSNFISYHDIKVSELKKDLPAHVKYVDNAVTKDACFEVLEELTQYLCGRYPSVFELKNGHLLNHLTGEDFLWPAGTLR